MVYLYHVCPITDCNDIITHNEYYHLLQPKMVRSTIIKIGAQETGEKVNIFYDDKLSNDGSINVQIIN